MKYLLSLFMFVVASCASIPTHKQTLSGGVNNDSVEEIAARLFASEGAPSVQCPTDKPCVLSNILDDEVSSESTQPLIRWIEAGNKAGAKALVLEINTPGGEVWSGMRLAKAIERSEAPVICVVDGEAASMGAYILQSCQTRLMTKRSMLMFHEPSLSGVMSGRPNEWKSVAEMLKATSKAIAEHCAARLNISVEQYHEKVDGGLMWWLNWDEALSVQAIDGTVYSVKEAVKWYESTL